DPPSRPPPAWPRVRPPPPGTPESTAPPPRSPATPRGRPLGATAARASSAANRSPTRSQEATLQVVVLVVPFGFRLRRARRAGLGRAFQATALEIEHRHLRAGDQLLVVAGDDHGAAQAIEFDEQADDPQAHLVVDVAGGLVGDDQLGPV